MVSEVRLQDGHGLRLPGLRLAARHPRPALRRHWRSLEGQCSLHPVATPSRRRRGHTDMASEMAAPNALHRFAGFHPLAVFSLPRVVDRSKYFMKQLCHFN